MIVFMHRIWKPKLFKMNIPWTSVAVAAALCLAVTTKAKALPPSVDCNYETKWSAHTDGDIEQRLKTIQLPFEAKYNAQVRYQIKRYVTSGYKDAQLMLGRSVHFFPIFDHYLNLKQLPLELKYLPMVESTLRPYVKSNAGAAGLWQFIPSTARMYKLRITDYIDERHDPYKSTEAATEMLGDLYKQFGEWELVLAAYNCGPGKVAKAIRLAGGCKDFWSIKDYLPKETQDYIPRYIAAAYLANYYRYHGLKPVLPNYLSTPETRTFKVHDYITFRDISYVSGISRAVLEYLNPGYQKGFIPKSTSGNYLILPVRIAPAFQKLLAEKTGNRALYDQVAPPGMFKTNYIVGAGDQIAGIAQRYQCNVDDIVEWNGLATADVFVNQELVLLLPRGTHAIRP